MPTPRAEAAAASPRHRRWWGGRRGPGAPSAQPGRRTREGMRREALPRSGRRHATHAHMGRAGKHRISKRGRREQRAHVQQPQRHGVTRAMVAAFSGNDHAGACRGAHHTRQVLCSVVQAHWVIAHGVLSHAHLVHKHAQLKRRLLTGCATNSARHPPHPAQSRVKQHQPPLHKPAARYTAANQASHGTRRRQHTWRTTWHTLHPCMGTAQGPGSSSDWGKGKARPKR